jgi:predicted DNA-binding protein
MKYKRLYRGKLIYMRSTMLNVPANMYDQLDAIAKRENKPRSYIMREMLNKGIEEREKRNKQHDNN